MPDIAIQKAETGSALTPAEDLFATKDGRLVGADDPEANELVARAGQNIPPNLVEQYGIEAGGKAKAKVEPKAEAPKAEESGVLTRDSIKHIDQGGKAR